MRSSGANRRPRASSRCRGRSSCNARARTSGRPRRWARPCASATRCGWVGRAAPALALANDSTLRLDERTTLQLRGGAEEERSLIDLILGGVYFFSHRPRALEVDTPFVNAAAEGTEFLVRVGADRAEVVMLDGRVLLRNPQGELRVASGDAALIPAGAGAAADGGGAAARCRGRGRCTIRRS